MRTTTTGDNGTNPSVSTPAGSLSTDLTHVVYTRDAAGQAVGRVLYDPYGEIITSTLPVTLTDRLFAGARFDGTIGLYQMGARWYDPARGR